MTTYLDNYCGLYCDACSVRIYGETGCSDGFVNCLGNVPKTDIVCGGCKSHSTYAGCRACLIRKCAVKKGIEHCIKCEEYPCGMFKQWRIATKLLPHVGEVFSCLDEIRREGMDAWFESQDKRWSCPDCGARFSWYARECPSCGYSLNEKAYKLNGFRRILCRLILPSAYKKGKAL